MKHLKVLLVTILSLALIGCAGATKKKLAADAKQNLKKIAVVEIVEPEYYNFYPEQLQGGYALYMFGALGGLVLGGIEAARQKSASEDFNTALSPHPPAIAVLWNDALQTGLREKGYQVTSLKSIKKKKNGKMDCSDVQGRYDAILVSEINAGYTQARFVTPQVITKSQLFDADCKNKIFEESFLYGSQPIGELTFINTEGKYGFEHKEAMYGDMQVAQLGIRTGVKKIADKVISEL